MNSLAGNESFKARFQKGHEEGDRSLPAEKVGLLTPRAFSQYDPLKVPQPKYFQEVLENSLSEDDIALFC